MSVTVLSSATEAVEHCRRCSEWHVYHLLDVALCEDCHHPSAAWALAAVWVSDEWGTWHQWTCPTCLVGLRRDRDVFTEVVGYGLCEVAW